MKKNNIVLVILGIITYVIASLLFMKEQKPDLERIFEHIKVTEDDTFLLIENKTYTSSIYETDQEGNVLNVFNKGNNSASNKELIRDMEISDGIYFLMERGEGLTDEVYEVCKIASDWKTSESIGELKKEITFLIKNFYIDKNTIYLTGVDELDMNILVYSLDLNSRDEGFVECMKRTAPIDSELNQSMDIISAIYNGTDLYVLTNEGALFYYTDDDESAEIVSSRGSVSWISESNKKILYNSTDEEAIFSLDKENTSSELIEWYSNIMSIDVSSEKGSLAILHRDDELKKSVTFYTEDSEYHINKLSSMGIIRFDIYAKGLVLIACVVGIIFLLFGITIYLIKRRHRISILLAVGAFFINVSFVSSVCISIYIELSGSLIESREISTNVYLAEEAIHFNEEMSKDEIEIEVDDFINSKAFSIAKQSLINWAIPTYAENEILFSIELLHIGKDKKYILYSMQNAYGRNVDGIYDKKILDLLHSEEPIGFKGQKAMFRGWDYVYTLYTDPYFTDKESDLVWLARAEIRDIPQRTKALWQTCLKLGVIFGGTFSIILMLVIFIILRPIKSMSQSMERVTMGFYDLPESLYPNNEFGDMWRYLHKMCKALKVQKYSSGNVLDYYRKFAPDNFEVLFGKAKMQEVRVGNVVAVNGTMTAISVMRNNIPYIYNEGDSYTKYLNKLVQMIEREDEKNNHSVLLMNGQNIKSIRRIYPSLQSNDALINAMDLLHELEKWEDARELINPCILIFNGKFTCGVAGTTKSAYPFAISKESEEFFEYERNFKSIGVRLAITAETKAALTMNPALRYIGYIVNKEESSYKIYEVLDVYNKSEKEKKINNTMLFDRGLCFYYKNEFYEARNCFSEIVKNCVEDGVAKWYLFACDAIMANKDKLEVSHQLFEIID